MVGEQSASATQAGMPNRENCEKVELWEVSSSTRSVGSWSSWHVFGAEEKMSRSSSRLKISRSGESMGENVGEVELTVKLWIDKILAENRSKNTY